MKIEPVETKEYREFVDKFKPKLTTDDCYTPESVYAAVRDWAVEYYRLEGREVVRPFWPGGDYENHDYPAGCVVIDNPRCASFCACTMPFVMYVALRFVI